MCNGKLSIATHSDKAFRHLPRFLIEVPLPVENSIETAPTNVTSSGSQTIPDHAGFYKIILLDWFQNLEKEFGQAVTLLDLGVSKRRESKPFTCFHMSRK